MQDIKGGTHLICEWPNKVSFYVSHPVLVRVPVMGRRIYLGKKMSWFKNFLKQSSCLICPERFHQGKYLLELEKKSEKELLSYLANPQICPSTGNKLVLLILEKLINSKDQND